MLHKRPSAAGLPCLQHHVGAAAGCIHARGGGLPAGRRAVQQSQHVASWGALRGAGGAVRQQAAGWLPPGPTPHMHKADRSASAGTPPLFVVCQVSPLTPPSPSSASELPPGCNRSVICGAQARQVGQAGRHQRR